MKRYPAFDPPEYVTWRADPALVRAYRDTLARDAERQAVVQALTRDELLSLYFRLVRARQHDIGLKRWVRQGVISKAWLGTGEEAATVGPTFALDTATDYVAPMIRNAAACADMGMPLADMFRAYLATADSPSTGRDLHAGSWPHHVVQPVSPVGVMVPVSAGIALAVRMRGEAGVVMNWVGDGSAKAGVSHEGLNFAAVQRLPVVYILQNNQVALGTRLDQHHAGGDFADWPAAYGIAGWGFDGNNVLDAYAASVLAVQRCRRVEGPVLLVADTFRMGGHATHDEREARDTFPAALFSHWGQRDPIGLYEEYLKQDGISAAQLEGVEASATAEVEAAAAAALESRDHLPDPRSALSGVYAS
jgi:pyruvate dehydrogenase E1 component alpha subunit/2-oxoisovalerate dehydrogenase E1 component alpha subunit